MNTIEPASSSLFDRASAFGELSDIIARQPDPDEARAEVVEHLKAAVKDERSKLRQRLEEDCNGRRCAQGLSNFQDELICLLYDLTVQHFVKDIDPDVVERVTIIATGGYGRGLLAPGSDIDLLFLIPESNRKLNEQIAECILYLLWDLGFKVGHATRTITESLQFAASDTTIRTTMLDARRIRGTSHLFETLTRRLYKEIVTPNRRAFVDAKMTERDDRHERSGNARYLVEPDIKDGKGGLRDLHTLHWLSKAIYGDEVGSETVATDVYTQDEADTFHRCEDFLWTVRCFLHFLTGRPEERLTFDLQSQMAESLGYKKHAGLRAVERFMKHYFLVAKDVGELTTILCGYLEIQQFKSTPTLSDVFPTKSWRARRLVRKTTEFRVDNDRLNVVDDKVFTRDPVNILRLFATSAKLRIFLHPNAVRLLRKSIRLVDAKLRQDPVANQIFLDILTNTSDPALTLRRMNDAGVLGRFILPFRRVVGMMQFNMYHHYTVDEHLIKTVEMLTEIENGRVIEQLPLSSEIFDKIENRRALFVAALLHDIGKGRREDHSVVGARIARDVCPQLGVSPEQTETIAWLIEEHLTMSNTAQSRDISDPQTIHDFAAIVKTPERLKLLLLLTVADIRAVGPGTWNGWKGQLLRQLYYETDPNLGGGESESDRREQIETARNHLSSALTSQGWQAEIINAHADRFFDDYWLRFDTNATIEHAALISRTDANEHKLASTSTTDAFTAITELTIFAPNHARLLSLFAGACAAAGANIASAIITTTRDGFALDTFLLQRKFDNDDEETQRAQRIHRLIERLLKGESRLKALLAKPRLGEQRVEAFSVEPEIMINNDDSNRFTVIEVAGRDRPGLLYDLTAALSDLNLDISSAHITTFGEKAVDVFYVTDLLGKKLESDIRVKAITDRLSGILAPNKDELVENA